MSAESRTAVRRVGVDATALTAQPTGVGNYIRPLLLEMANAHPTTEFLLYSNDEIDLAGTSNLVPRISTPKRRGPWWQNTHLSEMLRADRPDVFWAANGLVPARRPRETAVVTTVHDLVYRFATRSLPLQSLVGRALFQPLAVSVADRVVAVSRATADDLYQVSGRRVDAVVQPVPDSRFGLHAQHDRERVRERYGLADDFLLVTGTLEPRKNLVAFLTAYDRCQSKGVALPVLALAGRSGWRDGPIREAVQRGESAGWLRPLGYVDAADLPGLYAAAQAFVMPSRYEGFGMPILEAQMCGTPVLHGPHASMVEAGGGVGVVISADTEGLERDLTSFAAGESPLACRVPASVSVDLNASAATMWRLIEEAVRHRSGERP